MQSYKNVFVYLVDMFYTCEGVALFLQLWTACWGVASPDSLGL